MELIDILSVYVCKSASKGLEEYVRNIVSQVNGSSR